MTKDELINQLKSDLATMIDWTDAISDEYLDGDESSRREFVADRKAARATISIEPDTV
jgi:hypothetical protein